MSSDVKLFSSHTDEMHEREITFWGYVNVNGSFVIRIHDNMPLKLMLHALFYSDKVLFSLQD